jgi:hypothetical protein
MFVLTVANVSAADTAAGSCSEHSDYQPFISTTTVETTTTPLDTVCSD